MGSPYESWFSTPQGGDKKRLTGVFVCLSVCLSVCPIVPEELSRGAVIFLGNLGFGCVCVYIFKFWKDRIFFCGY